MIGRLRGVVVAKTVASVILDVAGVGYEVAVTPRALVELPGVGEEAVVHTHTHVREDQLALFGFPTDSERDLFRLLLGASGIGPKVAMAICGSLQPDEIRRAVLADDTAALETVPGIGKRSAQKLILELRPRFDVDSDDLPGAAAGSNLADVRTALEGLGYQATEIREALRDLPAEGGVEELLRTALQTLGRSQ